MSSDKQMQATVPDEAKAKAVRTSEARAAATSEVTAELRKMAEKLLQLSGREAQTELLEELKKGILPETREFLRLTELREKQHFNLIRRVVPFIEDLKGRSVDHDQHDHSKDKMFFFVAASYFDGGVQGQDMKDFIGEELKRHYKHESHHPEYELYHVEECTRDDIVEMAIDRLARNLQFGNGVVDLEVMVKFMPKFSKGDNEEKRKFFWESVLKYKDIVQEKFYEIYPDTREWSK